MFKFVDEALNVTTMYRLMIYGLITILVYAGIMIIFGGLPFSLFSLFISVAILYLSCRMINFGAERFFKAQANAESSTITALILSLVLTPPTKLNDVYILIGASAVAMLSKYLLAYKEKNIFNPTAITMVILATMGIGLSSWWVGGMTMLPIVALVGFLIVKKTVRWPLFIAFFLPAFVLMSISGLLRGMEFGEIFELIFRSSPIVFFGTVMLTEPQTTPPTSRLQVMYGLLVGILYGTQAEIGPLFVTPELALVLGNVFSFFVGFKKRIFFKLQQKNQLTENIIEFLFLGDKNFSFLPGQYMEWTLRHKNPDNRGNRRFFTIASSPTEDEVRICSRFNLERSSSFKTALKDLLDGDTITAAQLAGEFVLPDDSEEKLVFIAGGIGITPFRSMVKYLLDTRQKRHIVLFYVNKTADDIIYADLWEKAKINGVKTVYVLTEKEKVPNGWKGYVGYIDEKMLKAEVSYPTDKIYYLSGPSAMVDSYKKLLINIGVHRGQIITDYFPGY